MGLTCSLGGWSAPIIWRSLIAHCYGDYDRKVGLFGGSQVSTWRLLISSGRHAVTSGGGSRNPPLAPIPGCYLNLVWSFFPPCAEGETLQSGPPPKPIHMAAGGNCEVPGSSSGHFGTPEKTDFPIVFPLAVGDQ